MEGTDAKRWAQAAEAADGTWRQSTLPKRCSECTTRRRRVRNGQSSALYVIRTTGLRDTQHEVRHATSTLRQWLKWKRPFELA
jgi:hypothetical protein